jgi:hypothetical protein
MKIISYCNLYRQDSVYDQRDAAGFIKLNALRLRTLGTF